MTRDDWDDDDERVPPDLQSVRDDLLEVLARPAVERLNRAAIWWAKLRTLKVDWTGFAVTRGGFFDVLGMSVAGDSWYDGSPAVDQMDRIATGLGWQAQVYAFGSAVRWEPWRRWRRPFTLADALPRLTAQRGGIRIIAPARLDLGRYYADGRIEIDP